MQFGYVDFWQKPKDPLLARKHLRVGFNSLIQRAKTSQTDIFASIQAWVLPQPRDSELHWCSFYIDVDWKKDLTIALEATRKVVQYFLKLGIPEECIRVNFSGSKGFHVCVNPYVFGMEPSSQLTYQIKDAVRLIAEQTRVKTLKRGGGPIDDTIYTVKRLMRVVGSVHGSTGLRAIPLSIDTLMSEEIESIQFRAQQGACDPLWRYEWPTDVEPVAKRWWDAVLRGYFERLSSDNEDAAKLLITPEDEEGFPDCVKSLRDGPKGPGLRNATTWQIALYLRAIGWPESKAQKYLATWTESIPDNLWKHKARELRGVLRNCSSTVQSAYAGKGKYFSCVAIRNIGAPNNPVACAGSTCPHIQDDQEGVPEISLAEAIRPQYLHKPVAFTGTTILKDKTPILIPKVAQMKCTPNNDSTMCQKCFNYAKTENHFELGKRPEYALKLAVTRDDTQALGVLNAAMRVPRKCTLSRIRIREHESLLRAAIQPEFQQTFSHYGTEFRENDIFIMGSDIDMQKTYRFKGILDYEPRTRLAVHVCSSLEPVGHDFENFQQTEELHDALKVFCPREETAEALEEKIHDIHDELERVVYPVRGRRDQAIAMDLVWHSVLSFNFLGHFVPHGWLEVAVVGDTGEGKSEIVEQFLSYYRVGKMIHCENTSSAGLLIGVDKIGNRQVARLGDLPRNDGGLVVLDEFHQLDEIASGNLTQCRSTGVASMHKIVWAEAPARTRKIMIGNPGIRGSRKHRRMSHRVYGVEWVQTLFTSSEDVRRCDLLLGFKEISDAEMNLYEPLTEIEQNYPPDLCSQLIAWGHSRRPHQIVFTEAAVKFCLEQASRLSSEYSASIPLLLPGDTKFKIARIAAAAAVRTYSSDHGGETLIVKTYHCQYAVRLVERIYTSRDLQYDRYSEKEISKHIPSEEKLAEMALQFVNHDNWYQAFDYFIHQDPGVGLSVQDLETATKLGFEGAKTFLNTCRTYRLIKKLPRSQAFELTRRGLAVSELLLAWLKEGKIERLIEGGEDVIMQVCDEAKAGAMELARSLFEEEEHLNF